MGVGTLKEYDGWDFSEVMKEAETQNPFGINNKASTASATLAAKDVSSKGGLVLRPGARVTITGLKARPELNGPIGVVETFEEDKGRFAIALGKEKILLKPTNLAAAPP